MKERGDQLGFLTATGLPAPPRPEKRVPISRSGSQCSRDSSSFPWDCSSAALKVGAKTGRSCADRIPFSRICAVLRTHRGSLAGDRSEAGSLFGVCAVLQLDHVHLGDKCPAFREQTIKWHL